MTSDRVASRAETAREQAIKLGRHVEFKWCRHGPDTWCNHKAEQYLDVLLGARFTETCKTCGGRCTIRKQVIQFAAAFDDVPCHDCNGSGRVEREGLLTALLDLEQIGWMSTGEGNGFDAKPVFGERSSHQTEDE